MNDVLAASLITADYRHVDVKKTYHMSGHTILMEGGLCQGKFLTDVRLSLQPGDTLSEADIRRNALIQSYLTKVARKLTVQTSTLIQVTINMFRLPSQDEFLTGYEGPITDEVRSIYTECRGLTSAILWMLHVDFPVTFREE